MAVFRHIPSPPPVTKHIYIFPIMHMLATKKSDLPSTIQNSGKTVQEIFEKTLNSAHEQYGSGRREYQTAYAQLKKMGYRKDEQKDKWVKTKQAA